MKTQVFDWVVSSVFTRRGFATKLRTEFDATLRECSYDDLTEAQRLALFQASHNVGHRFIVWLNWRWYDLRRLLGAASVRGPWAP